MNIDVLSRRYARPHAEMQHRGRWLLWLVLLQIALLFAPTMLWLWERWTVSVWQNGHGILILAVPLAIAVNIVRVLVLSLLVHWIGLDVLATSAHEISGMLTFVVALPIVFWLGRAPVASAKV